MNARERAALTLWLHWLVGMILALLGVGCEKQHLLDASPTVASVRFSPKGGIQDEIVFRIGKAQTRIHMQAYAFNSEPIAQALVAARRRGLDVQLCLDRKWTETSKHAQADLCHAGLVRVFLDGKHQIAHSKVIVIDDEWVITGSYNFTTEAEAEHLENVVVLRSRPTAALYETNFQAHKAHSEELK